MLKNPFPIRFQIGDQQVAILHFFPQCAFPFRVWYNHDSKRAPIIVSSRAPDEFDSNLRPLLDSIFMNLLPYLNFHTEKHVHLLFGEREIVVRQDVYHHAMSMVKQDLIREIVSYRGEKE